MSDYESNVIQKADYVDRLLDKGFGGGEADDFKATTWNELLTRNEIEPLGSRFDLSTLDEVVYCVTGVAGGVLGLTKSFSEAMMTSEGLHQKFDRLSKNYVEQVTGQKGTTAIDNCIGGGAHRLVGPGHDLTRFFETIDQMMRGEFRTNVRGVKNVANRYRAGCADYLPIDDPVDAAIILILHLISDFFSKQSLPLPGRTRLTESENREVVSAVFKEFRNSNSLRTQVASFLGNMSGTLFISLILRLYRYMDLFVIEGQRPDLEQLKLGDDIKYHLLHRNAQTIASVISTGKAALSGNPANVNYLSFIQVIRSGTSINRLTRKEQDRLLASFSGIRNQVEAL